ncbi:aminotransferase class I/II-fold pyridoxal phosphate-dependent enzyme [Fulvivirgaceae bacterium PWU20]|uniref:Aminotransferase class I/II-fold pyridoxal phosphate-dependent enzyme n=2 Tax=Chryseosolibacter indicus TaxID=2782351 RepID=A0ABS5VV82_9BACT|nr:aminotransferase class I/II-fold pyridoxal phosphate-dependent enzyme [Chryseosolibacter indicus]
MDFLKDAIDSNWIAPVGPHVEAFERELGVLLRLPNVVCVSSGTAAIHLGLLSLGVQKGDEVICSSLTFCASANPIVYCGATPVFVDSEEDSWNVDPHLLEEAIEDRIKKKSKRPKAIVVVHLYGMPANMNAILSIAKKYEISVLEDSAEALGSLYEGKPLGTLGDVGILSFNGNKIITTSGGGALLSPNRNILSRARFLRQEAKESVPYYQHREIGYNYRFSNVLASLGRAQIKVLTERVEKRRAIFEQYYAELTNCEAVSFQPELEGSYSNRWLTVMLFKGHEKAETIRLLLERMNIESRRVWKPMHLQPIFKECAAYLNGVSENLFNYGLCVPSGTSLTSADVSMIANIIKDQLNASSN